MSQTKLNRVQVLGFDQKEVRIDGEKLNGVTFLKIEMKPNKPAKILIEMLADVVVAGDFETTIKEESVPYAIQEGKYYLDQDKRVWFIKTTALNGKVVVAESIPFEGDEKIFTRDGAYFGVWKLTNLLNVNLNSDLDLECNKYGIPI